MQLLLWPHGPAAPQAPGPSAAAQQDEGLQKPPAQPQGRLVQPTAAEEGGGQSPDCEEDSIQPQGGQEVWRGGGWLGYAHHQTQGRGNPQSGQNEVEI